MVVGHRIAIGADDEARTLAHAGLAAALIGLALAELRELLEEVAERTVLLLQVGRCLLVTLFAIVRGGIGKRDLNADDSGHHAVHKVGHAARRIDGGSLDLRLGVNNCRGKRDRRGERGRRHQACGKHSEHLGGGTG